MFLHEQKCVRCLLRSAFRVKEKCGSWTWLCCVMGAASCHSAALNWDMGQTQLESVSKKRMLQSSALDVRCTQCDNDIGMVLLRHGAQKCVGYASACLQHGSRKLDF